MLLFTDQFSELLYRTLDWLFKYYIEVFGTVTGLIYIVYSARGNILLWLFGILSSTSYIYVFFKSGFYADMGINVYYVLISVYGWYHWKFERNKGQKVLPYARLDQRTGIYLLLISLVLFLFIALVLNSYTDSTVVIGDAFTTAFSITATWMLARKIIQHWLVWIVVNLVSIGLYIYKGLYPTVLLFVVYTLLSFFGYQNWLREWKVQEQSQ